MSARTLELAYVTFWFHALLGLLLLPVKLSAIQCSDVILFYFFGVGDSI